MKLSMILASRDRRCLVGRNHARSRYRSIQMSFAFKLLLLRLWQKRRENVSLLSEKTIAVTPAEALEAVQKTQLSAGIKLTGASEPIDVTATKPVAGSAATAAAGASASASASASLTKAKSNTMSDTVSTSTSQERFSGGFGGLGGIGGLGGYGGIGGFGGFGAYRFGYSFGGLGGWVYPLGYWNSVGSGRWGGRCGLGLAYAGLYDC